MTLQEIERQILALPATEKAALMQMLTQTFDRTARGIIKTPGVCGGDACIGDTRIPVWSLVCDRRLGMSDARILESFPDLTASDLVNAWAYAKTHQEEIEQAIVENDRAMSDHEVA
jgi:uncharacterized protein (DUF433 family)